MGYLRKVGTISVWMLLTGVLFLLLSIIFYNTSNFRALIEAGDTYRLFGKLMTIVLFVGALNLFLLSGTLHVLRKDAEEEFEFIEDRILNEIEKRQRAQSNPS